MVIAGSDTTDACAGEFDATSGSNWKRVLLVFFAFASLAMGSTVQAAGWAPTGLPVVQRSGHAAALLFNGNVLIVGGASTAGAKLRSSEVFNAATGSWAAVGNLSGERAYFTATALPSGKVLVTGGRDNNDVALKTAEIYDPATGIWSGVGDLASARYFHTATLLRNGKVLVTGGVNGTGSLASAELFDPDTGHWVTTGSLNQSRYDQTATLLPNGKVLIAGGLVGTAPRGSAELYDPALGVWTPTGNLGTPRGIHTATLLASGRVLVAGGYNGSVIGSVEQYDPATGAWTSASLLSGPRQSHTATLLPSGKLLVTGGYNGSTPLRTSEIFDPNSGTWSPPQDIGAFRSGHTATLLANGKVLVAGGANDPLPTMASIFDPAIGTTSLTGPLSVRRHGQIATLLLDGRVLVAGGVIGSGFPTLQAELYDPAIESWSSPASMSLPRELAAASLLSSGKVLVVGGYDGNQALNSAELFIPESGTWTPAGNMTSRRECPSATVLPNGDVLVAGGGDGNSALKSAEVYSHATGSWASTGSMAGERLCHTATLLANGTVLVAGGVDSGGTARADAEIYNPNTGSWAATGAMSKVQFFHAATLLPSGKVLRTGGIGGGSAELYDPASASWTPAGTPAVNRYHHTATLLANGSVLVAGGLDTATGDTTFVAELYDPSIGGWSSVNLVAGRMQHTATLLLNGKVLLAGGLLNNSGTLNSTTELFDLGQGFANARRPVIATVGPLEPAGTLTLAGADFAGDSGASDGSTKDSSTGFPLVQLQRVDNGAVKWVAPGTNWSATAFQSVPQSNLAHGPYRVTVFANGIPSVARIVAVAPANSGGGSGTATVVSNPYGPITVQGANLNGNVISGLQSNTVIQLGTTPGSVGSFVEIDFDGFNVANGATLTFRSGASGQTVLIRNSNATASVIGGLLQAQGGNGAAAPKLYLQDPNGMTINSTSTVLAQTGLTIDTLGSTVTSGNKLLNLGWIDGGPSLTLRTGGVTGGGGFAGNAITVSTFGDVRNPVNGSHFLANGVQLYPSSGGTVALILNDYGPSPQFLNLMVNGNASLSMPSAWATGTTLPQNNAPVPAGGVRPAGTGEPSFGGGSMIVQATGSMSLVGGASNDFVFPGAIVLKAGGTLDLNGLTFNQGWTTTGRAFQGVFFESPNIVSASTVRVLSNNLNWTNFSTMPNGHFRLWTLVQKPDGTSQYDPADSVAPHVNTYSVLIEAAANGLCWVCMVNSTPVNVQ